MSNVVDNIITKCREAILGGVPILYIKTDSDMLIRKVIENENRPLVQLLYKQRPFGEEKPNDGKYRIDDADNLSFRRPKDNEVETITYPHIWVHKVVDAGALTISDLESYVIAHEDPGHPRYDILRYSVVVLYSSTVNITSSLIPYTEFIDVDYPDEDEIRNIILRETRNNSHLVADTPYLSVLCTMFVGFSEEEIVLTIGKIRASATSERPDPFEFSDDVEKIIYDKKKQKMEGGILEYCKVKESSIGGMDNYKRWLEKQIEPIKNSNMYSKKIGTNPPKGVLLCGIPGCGKSEAAKFTSHILKLPLLKMDMGSLMDKYVGGSEQNMRNALKLAETMSPCILWIDELEKGFSGATGDNDTAGFKRMFGHMLGWMQDNEKPCFIFATANDIGALPKEFFRSGRFDALYAVYLPTCNECVSIIKSCMDRAEKKVKAAKKNKAENDVFLFDKACYDASFLSAFVEKRFADSDQPRIIIGADIKKIVDTALRSLIKEDRINQAKWGVALSAAADECTVYGDSKENIESIAVSYCRMLRKGFVPTADNVLFNDKDYHVENAEQLKKLKSKRESDIPEKEKQHHKDEIEAAQILKKSGKFFDNKYDKAVYDLLYLRINDIALHIEQVEREKMIGR